MIQDPVIFHSLDLQYHMQKPWTLRHWDVSVSVVCKAEFSISKDIETGCCCCAEALQNRGNISLTLLYRVGGKPAAQIARNRFSSG